MKLKTKKGSFASELNVYLIYQQKSLLLSRLSARGNLYFRKSKVKYISY